MENTETPITTEESTTVVESVTEETPTTTTIVENTPIVNGEATTVTENVETNEDEVVPPSEPTTLEVKETEPEITTPTDEQENVTDTNAIVPPTCLSPGRANIPLKEVNESEKEEAAVITNGTENGISKKRELEQEDEQPEEVTNDNDERNGSDSIKKIKTCETIDTPIIESKEPENNIIINGNTAVEV